LSGSTTVVFLGEPEHWLIVANGEIVNRGQGFPLATEGSRVVGVVPASDVVVHQVALPKLTDPQARAAARLLVAENSVSPLSTLHVAVGAESQGERSIVALSTLHMAQYLVELASREMDPESVIAAPLILPRPDNGFVIGDLGGETVIRGRDAAFLDDPALTALLTDGQILTFDTAETDAAIIAAVRNPEVDLRQGAFRLRRRWAMNRIRLRRLGYLATGCLAMLIISPLVELSHVNAAARQIEAHNDAIAQSLLPADAPVVDPLAQLDERIRSLGGYRGGFLHLTNAVASAASNVPNVEVGTMSFDAAGLHFDAHAASPRELAVFETEMGAAGLIVTPSSHTTLEGRPATDYTVRAR
jgi:general secretion pathway protein L